MTAIAMTTMAAAIAIIWGGLLVSVISLARRSRAKG
ncbi:MetS family NSS transporter small subunit [Propionibacterium australiense]|uniref:MetS family NSS transporter small subunit n=1 Tax=Propionibacterium australiense TaxID=119981 RepID=A0A383S2W0_9ACTN|nr:MetS family NSS transporter small subunit [Propionibacterium australiense]RLP06466.1 MetS family NSS transporter small subunit [Propionibacterium australiense]RLP11589.1 MetS family NSS transporter small subunit [Propionibacterium australiense]SYZ32310.1 Hypothetical protein PROPAUS_0185 [Propionibacterium australiense]VEH90466.1 Uncharacterised protein [Propionibacterium australiense]